MRQGSQGVRRSRGRHNNNGGGNGGGQNGGNRVRSAASLRHQTFDSNGPDVRVRGNAWQVHEKYQSLARDAASAGDRVLAESYLQHAEHYYRIIEAIEEATQAEQGMRRNPSSSSFDQQPDMPSNYFTPDGQLAASAQGQPAGQNPQPQAAATVTRSGFNPTPAQAEVDKRPSSPSSFFSSEEDTEDHSSGLQQLVAQR